MPTLILPKKWTRRTLLSRFGNGAAMAAVAPFIPVMEAGAQSDKAIRYIQWFTANAANNNNGFWQENNGATVFPVRGPYAPLNAEHKADVSVVSNIYLKSAEDTGKNPHNDTSWACMTGRENATLGVEDSSLDQIIANDLRAKNINTPFKSLVLAVNQPRKNFGIPTWEGKRMPVDYSPQAVFDRLYGSVEASSGASAGLEGKRKSVLDYMNASLSRLRLMVSADDKQKLDQHLTAIEEIENRLGLDASGCDSFEGLTVPSAPSPDVTLDLYIDLIVAAFACDLTRVASVQMSAGHDFHDYRWLDPTFSGEFHSWTHGIVEQAATADREQLPDAAQRVARAMTWRSEKFARLLTKLKATPDVEGNVLDNSGVLWWTETARAHTYTNATWLLAGKMGGKLRSGHRQNVGGAHHNRLLTTIARAAGVDTNRIGDTAYQAGTLSAFEV